MTKLVLKKQIKDSTAGSFLSYGYLFKEPKRIVLKDETFVEIVSVPESRFGTRFIVSPDHSCFLFLPALFPSSITLYSLPTLKPRDEFKEGCLYKDACFSHDGKRLYLLADKEIGEKAETLLFSYNRENKERKTYFLNEGKRFDALFFSPVYCCPTLLNHSGKISYFQDGQIIKERKTAPFHKISFRDKGSNLISDSPAGFQISSLNGKVIRKCDFLLPRESKNPTPLEKKERQEEKELEQLSGYALPKSRKRGEHYYDRLTTFTSNQVFYVTKVRPENEYYLYFFSLNSFRRKKQIKLKGKYLARNYRQKHLFISTSKGMYIYLLTKGD